MTGSRKRRSGRGRRGETAAERAYANRWYTLAETYEVLTALALPPEPRLRPPSHLRSDGRGVQSRRAAGRG